MKELFAEALLMIEGDVKWLRDAAEHCRDYSNRLPDGDKERAGLLIAVYLERAKSH